MNESKNKMNSVPTVLAPAGNIPMLKAVIAAGADSVYLGVEGFHARTKTEGNEYSFNLQNLKEWIDYAHLFNVKVFLTLNVLIKDSEMERAIQTAKAAYDFNIDALIIQDLGLMQRLKKELPTLPLHASTQMGIHNLQGAIFARDLGFDRVILAREALLTDIKKIKDGTDLEIEAFVHGAQCVSFSGNCYFSSYVSGYSGNRGKCMQLCRKKYDVQDTKNGYFLSPKDLCRIDVLRELMDAGVTCFKIEGRLRRAEYAAEVTRIYKQKILSIKNQASDNTSKNDIDNLKKLFNRGDFSVGRLFNNTHDIYPLSQSHIGLKAGRVIGVKQNKALLSCNLSKGDGVKFMRNGQEVGSALIGENGNSTGFSGSVAINDEVNLTTDFVLNSDILKRQKRLPLSIDIAVLQDKEITATLVLEDFLFSFSSDIIPQKANSLPLTADSLKESLSKLGDTVYFLKDFSAKVENVFLAKSQLNLLRRQMIAEFNKARLKDYSNHKQVSCKKGYAINQIISNDCTSFKPKGIITQVSNLDCLTKQIIKNSDFISINPSDYSKIDLNRLKEIDKSLILNLPVVASGEDYKILQEAARDFETLIINNLYGFAFKDKNLILGPFLNLINSQIPLVKILSPEADKPYFDTDFIYASSSFPLMTLSHCVRRAVGVVCSTCSGEKCIIKDDHGVSYPLRRVKLHNCYTQVLGKECFSAGFIAKNSFSNPNKNSFNELSENDFVKSNMPHLFIDLTDSDNPEEFFFRVLSSVKNAKSIAKTINLK